MILLLGFAILAIGVVGAALVQFGGMKYILAILKNKKVAKIPEAQEVSKDIVIKLENNNQNEIIKRTFNRPDSKVAFVNKQEQTHYNGKLSDLRVKSITDRIIQFYVEKDSYLSQLKAEIESLKWANTALQEDNKNLALSLEERQQRTATNTRALAETVFKYGPTVPTAGGSSSSKKKKKDEYHSDELDSD